MAECDLRDESVSQPLVPLVWIHEMVPKELIACAHSSLGVPNSTILLLKNYLYRKPPEWTCTWSQSSCILFHDTQAGPGAGLQETALEDFQESVAECDAWEGRDTICMEVPYNHTSMSNKWPNVHSMPGFTVLI